MAQNMQIPNKSLPTVELVHPKSGRVVVNECDASEYIAKGYKHLGGVAGKIEHEEPKVETPNYAAMNRDQLVAAATEAGIENPHRLNKAKLLEALGVTAEEDGD